jgi:phage baseplate assembly protein W
MTQVDHPFHVDGRGRTATTTEADHVRDLIEQVLFTAPGERVNRPTFGSGLLRLVFAPNGDALAAATQLTVQGNLQQWLGDVIQVNEVQVEEVEAELRVVVRYTVRETQESRVDVFGQGV